MINIAAKFLERRSNERKSPTGLLPGRLYMVEAKMDIECKPTNVSSQGMGIISSTMIPNNSLVEMRTHDQVISLRIVWVRRDFGKRDLFRYGLVVEDRGIDLVDVFETCGCLK